MALLADLYGLFSPISSEIITVPSSNNQTDMQPILVIIQIFIDSEEINEYVNFKKDLLHGSLIIG
jgi:hypothetical protein